ncbi:MAG: phage portal protein [Oscillospiraceae bacterium]|nr:phage portal protein [Oscillospiraceae bacterium]
MLYGIDYLRTKLNQKKYRVRLRYQYYEMKQAMRKISALIPPEFRSLTYSLGWCAKAVDTLADRIVPDGFDHDTMQIGEIYRLNNEDVLYGSSVLSALISSCCFLYIGWNQDGYPLLQVIDGGNATGIIDPVTNLLTEGYAVLSYDEDGNPEQEAYFLPYQTDYYTNGKLSDSVRHKAPYALLAPVINRPDARRPFGHSRISRSCMDIIQSAQRTLQRTEVAAEFYSVPQKYIVGLSQEAEFNNRAATLSSFLNFSVDEDDKFPSLGQFQSGSIEPFLSQMKMLASLFAAETGLTLDDLGFTTENPSSVDAIRASHENLRLTARRAQQTFGTGFVNAGFLAACIRDNYSYERSVFADTRCNYLPIFEPDSSMLGVLGDAILKINQASDGFMGAKNIRALTGLRSDAE